jgi:hypothetical protein
MTGPAASSPNLVAVHERLRAILAPYRDRLHVAREGPGGMTLELPEYAGQPWGFAAGTRLGRRYVSYYLMGVYGDDGLAASISPELGRRMQGKSCFNFAKPDEPLFRELEALTALSIDRQPAITAAALKARSRRRERRGRGLLPVWIVLAEQALEIEDRLIA